MPKGTGRIVIDPFTNGLLTTLFGLEVVAVFAVLLALPGALPAGCPLTGPQAFAAHVPKPVLPQPRPVPGPSGNPRGRRAGLRAARVWAFQSKCLLGGHQFFLWFLV